MNHAVVVGHADIVEVAIGLEATGSDGIGFNVTASLSKKAKNCHQRGDKNPKFPIRFGDSEGFLLWLLL